MMKHTRLIPTGIALLGLMPFTFNLTLAQTAVQETTTITTTLGTISELGPETITVRSETSPNPVSYRYGTTTTYVDETGAPISRALVKAGTPVTVYYSKVGDRMVATKVVVRKAVVPAAPVIEEKKTTTTTTTTTTDD